MPRNCNECEHTRTCKSCFGALGCAYKEEIRKAILEAEQKKQLVNHPTV